jgi:FKBP-type peptidyl-prolyl cis-trans isomerase FkpA
MLHKLLGCVIAAMLLCLFTTAQPKQFNMYIKPQKPRAKVKCTYKVPKDYKKLKSGIYYKLVTKGNNTYKPIPGDYVLMNDRVYLNDSMVFDSYILNDNQPVPATIIKPMFNGDIMEGIMQLSKGDSAVFLIPADSVYRNGYYPEYAKPCDMVKYQIQLIDVKSKADYKREQDSLQLAMSKVDSILIANYIKREGIKDAQYLPNGLVIANIQKGEGANASSGSMVSVNYTGRLLNGTTFDSNVLPQYNHVEPFLFQLDRGKVIKGWDQAILQLNKASKAKLLIPSGLAYGTRGNGQIPPNTVLIFDVELVNIQ